MSSLHKDEVKTMINLKLLSSLLFLFLSSYCLPCNGLKWGTFSMGSAKKQSPLQTTGYTSEKIGKANLDWSNLGFLYRQTNSFVVCDYQNGSWGNIQLQTEPYINIHIAATALHYGQTAFEGLKAFHCKDGKIRIFRPELNVQRMNKSCKRICMPTIPEDLFLEAIQIALKANLEFIPPYGTGGAMYIRPLVFGSGGRIGLRPSDEYKLIILVIPVSDYYRTEWNPVPALVIEDYDRAAPKGVGHVKVAGNYAADLFPNMAAKQHGFPIALYLDAKTHSFIEEFSTSNFIGITNTKQFLTPKSEAILESITNLSIMDLARDEGFEVQRREIAVEELFQERFTEIGACGTAVVLTPINRIYYQNRVLELPPEEISQENSQLYKLYRRLRRIQCGEEVDQFSWLMEVN